MAGTATGIILVAGTLTWGNEWLQTNKVSWRVPVATLLAAGIIDMVSKIDDRAGIGVALMVFIGAVTAPFGGKSVIQEFNSVVLKGNDKSQPKKGK